MNHENDRSEGGARLLISVKCLPSVVSLRGSTDPDSFEAEQSWLLIFPDWVVYSPDMIYNSLVLQPTHLRDSAILCEPRPPSGSRRRNLQRLLI